MIELLTYFIARIVEFQTNALKSPIDGGVGIVGGLKSSQETKYGGPTVPKGNRIAWAPLLDAA